MKTKLVFLLLFLATFSSVFSENNAPKGLPRTFAPVGTEWNYGFSGHWIGPYLRHDYYRFVSVGDTLIQGRLCNTIEQKHGVNECRQSAIKTYFNMTNDTVFLYVASMNKFTPLYVFGANKGDSWIISHPEGDVKVVVDSVSTTSLFGSSSKQQFVTYYYNWQNSDLALKSSIISGIGDYIYLFNYAIHTLALCDDWKMPEGLRCYSNPELGSHKWTKLTCDTVFEENTLHKTYLKDGDSWSVVVSYGGWPSIVDRSYTVVGEILSNEKLYKKIYITGDSIYDKAKAEYVFNIREENGRWFFKHIHSNEVLLYDFNLQTGDTIVTSWNGPSITLKVMEVDSILLNGEWHKRLKMARRSEMTNLYYTTDYWIEGIGSDEGLLYNADPFEEFPALLCFHRNGELIYQNPKFNRCGYYTSIETPSVSQPIRITQVPTAKGNYQVQSEEEIEFISISDIQGRVLQQVRPYDHSLSISLAAQPLGVYVFRVVTARGNYFQKVINQF